MKNYTALFTAMFNMANHICKNYKKIVQTNIDNLTYNNFTFNFDAKSNTCIMLSSTEHFAYFSVRYFTIEFEDRKIIKIRYNDTSGEKQYLSFVKKFDEGEVCETYIYTKKYGKMNYPLSKEDQFIIALSDFPVALTETKYNKIMSILDTIDYDLEFSLDTLYALRP